MKFTPYSYSKIATFKQCPYKFKLQYIDKVKIPFETNIALEKGRYIHSLIEHHIKNEKKPEFKFTLSNEEDIKNYDKIFTDVKLNPLFQVLTNTDGCEYFTEEGFGIKIENKEIVATGYSDSAIIRGYIDFLKVCGNKAYIVDWKTGKFREEQDKLQTLIYALWTFKKFPQVQDIETIFYFVEHNKMVTHKYTRADFNFLLKEFLEAIKVIEKAEHFKKKPSPLCDWCPMKKFGYCDGEIDLEEKFKVTIGGK